MSTKVWARGAGYVVSVGIVARSPPNCDAVAKLLVAGDLGLVAGPKTAPSAPDAFADEGGANPLVKRIELYLSDARPNRHFNGIMGHLKADAANLAKIHEGGPDAKFERGPVNDGEGVKYVVARHVAPPPCHALGFPN